VIYYFLNSIIAGRVKQKFSTSDAINNNIMLTKISYDFVTPNHHHYHPFFHHRVSQRRAVESLHNISRMINWRHSGGKIKAESSPP
jgi:hypothetical protein